MFSAFLRVSLLSLVIGELRCPPSSPPYQVTCPDRPILFVFDETDWFGSEGFDSEVFFFQQGVIPITDWSLAASGPNKGLADFSQLYPITAIDDVCYMLDQLEEQYNSNFLSPSNNLYTMIETAMEWAGSLDEEATIVLFSSAQNNTEVALAADYVNKNKGSEIFLVVAMRGANFHAFPAKKVYDITNLTYPPYCLAYVLQQDACGDFGTCLLCPCPVQPGNFPRPPTASPATTPPLLSTPSTVPSTVPSTFSPTTSTTTIETSTTGATSSSAPVDEETSTPSTTAESSTKPAETTPESSMTATTAVFVSTEESVLTTLPPSESMDLNPVCECVYAQVWTDVVFLFDSSAATGDMGLQEMWVSVQSWLGFFNVQRHDYNITSHYMQIAVMVYAGTTQVISHLGDWNLDDLPEKLPYLGGLADNIEGAISAAEAEFEGNNRRQNCKKIIVLMATTYSSTNDPQQMANTFKSSEGVLMVFNYLETHGEPLPVHELERLASPGFFFNSRDNVNEDLQQAQCDASCFCRETYASFENHLRGYPTAGCYVFVSIGENFDRAQRVCNATYNGDLGVGESQKKTNFYRESLSDETFWINLIRTQEKGWAWYGKIPLNVSYSPWGPGQPSNDLGDDHVGVFRVSGGDDDEWQSTPGTNIFSYICEIHPCDSTHYCEQTNEPPLQPE